MTEALIGFAAVLALAAQTLAHQLAHAVTGERVRDQSQLAQFDGVHARPSSVTGAASSGGQGKKALVSRW